MSALRILRVKNYPRRPEDGMRKWEVIISRTLEQEESLTVEFMSQIITLFAFQLVLLGILLDAIHVEVNPKRLPKGHHGVIGRTRSV